MKNLNDLKKELEIVQLEERLEMVQLIANESLSGEEGNGCCTGVDSSCNPEGPKPATD